MISKRELGVGMQRSPLTIRMGVSEYLFRLATEAVRLYSNKVGAISSLDETVNGTADRVRTIVPDYGTAAIEEHFRIIPTEGSWPFSVTILDSNAPSYEAAAELLANALSKRTDVIDAVSLALYDLIAEQEVAQLAAKVGISAEAAADYRRLIHQPESNVVPFR